MPLFSHANADTTMSELAASSIFWLTDSEISFKDQLVHLG